MITIKEAKKKAEQEVIKANLEELKKDAEFNSSSNGTKTMRLALACGLSLQAMTTKLVVYGITV